MAQEGSSREDLDRQLQPHLSGPPAAVHDSEVQVSVGDDGQRTTWETFDDDGEITQASQERSSPVKQSGDSLHRNTRGPNDSATGEVKTNGTSVKSNVTSAADSVPPVAYHPQSGKVEVVGVGGGVGGGPVIQTRDAQPPMSPQQTTRLHEMDEPLSRSRIRTLKIMSLIAVVLFFPTGIPAVLLAWQIQARLEQGVMQGNIDKALKTARHSQRLSVASYVLFVVVGALAVGIVERITNGSGIDHSYVAHTSVNGR